MGKKLKFYHLIAENWQSKNNLELPLAGSSKHKLFGHFRQLFVLPYESVSGKYTQLAEDKLSN